MPNHVIKNILFSLDGWLNSQMGNLGILELTGQLFKKRDQRSSRVNCVCQGLTFFIHQHYYYTILLSTQIFCSQSRMCTSWVLFIFTLDVITYIKSLLNCPKILHQWKRKRTGHILYISTHFHWLCILFSHPSCGQASRAQILYTSCLIMKFSIIKVDFLRQHNQSQISCSRHKHKALGLERTMKCNLLVANQVAGRSRKNTASLSSSSVHKFVHVSNLVLRQSKQNPGIDLLPSRACCSAMQRSTFS